MMKLSPVWNVQPGREDVVILRRGQSGFWYPWLLLGLICAFLAGCASTPPESTALTEAQQAYQTARNNPEITRLAPEELQEAEARLRTAQGAWESGADESRVRHLSYLARQQVELAEAVTARKLAEQLVANAESQRQQIRLQARAQEAEATQRRLQEAERRAQDLEQQLKDLNAKRTERGVQVVLGDVLFDTGSAILKPEGARNVSRLAQYLVENPERRIMVEGFTDSTGGEEFNQKLSERRASSVRDLLIRQGVDASRIEVIGYGEAYPVASNDNAGGRQLNRRVEVIISDETGQIPPR